MSRFLRSLSATLVAIVMMATASVPLAALGSDEEPAPPGDDNIVVAVNLDDGTTTLEFGLSLRRVADGVVDETNLAAALASCTDCTTVALAFQAVLVTRDADVVVPQNIALAYNDQCTGCFTYASATQLVFGFSGPVRITAAGRHRLNDLRQELEDLQDSAAGLTPAQLVAVVDALETEFFAILSEETVEVGRRAVPASSAPSGDGPATPEDAASGSPALDDGSTPSSSPAGPTSTLDGDRTAPTSTTGSTTGSLTGSTTMTETTLPVATSDPSETVSTSPTTDAAETTSPTTPPAAPPTTPPATASPTPGTSSAETTGTPDASSPDATAAP